MKLYNIDHSPYSSRVRIQLRKQALLISIEPPPEALRSPEFKQRFPLGKLPVLELDNGQCLPDSWVIMQYLDASFPEASLQPAAPIARAQMHMLARYADTYLGPSALFPLFGRMMVPGGTEGADELLESLQLELGRLESLLAELPECTERALHLGDIALVTTMAYVLIVAPVFGVAKPLKDFSRIQHWWEWVQTDKAVKETCDEMTRAYNAFTTGLESPERS